MSRVAVIGAGAVGCYYGARLAEAGHRPRVPDPLQSPDRCAADRSVFVLERTNQGLDAPRILELPEGRGGLFPHRPSVVLQGLEERLHCRRTDPDDRARGRLADDRIFIGQHPDQPRQGLQTHLPEAGCRMVAQGFILVP